jgi:hypothetical protein
MRIRQVMGALIAPALCAAAPAQTPLEWNLRPQVEGLFQSLEAGQTASLAFVSDSLGFAHNSLNWYMRDRFWADYGMSGDGYLATGKGFSGGAHGPRDGLGYTATPTGVTLGSYAGFRSNWGYHTPDGNYARIQSAGSLELKLYGPICRLHYLIQPGGGILRVTLNGQVLVDAPTHGTYENATLEFATGQGPDTLSTVTLSSADGAVVQTCGIDMRTGLPGYTQHRLARGGSGPRDFNRSNTPRTADILADLDPDVIIVMLDWVGEDPDKEMATFVQDTHQLLDFYQQTLPEARFILMSHHPFKDNIEQEAAWLYQIAQERDIGFINLFDTVPGGFEAMDALGYMLDEVHLTPAGGSFFGNYIYGLLKQAGTCPADVNSDGILDLFDFLTFENLFVNRDPLADYQPDGSFDLFDFLWFQNAFGLGC